METFWFIALTFMLISYVILDGFDLGAGIIHLFAAKADSERRTILNAIGPVWDGNEVWLIASGGVLFFAFPKVYASSFSGFYLPLMMVLWLLILRGIGIELRHHLDNPMWRSFWDGTFSLASLLLAVFFGAALGNVVRGVPLNEDGYFFEPLWTTFTVVPESGILDWFTVLMGLVALFTLSVHGSNFIAMKSIGELQKRARRASNLFAWPVLISSILALLAAGWIRPGIWDNYFRHIWGFIFPVLGVLGLFGMFNCRSSNHDRNAFLSSSVFILGMGAATAFGLYPELLPASTNPEYGLSIHDSAAGGYSLRVGMIWWFIGMLLTGAYFIYLFRSFRGKTEWSSDEGY